MISYHIISYHIISYQVIFGKGIFYFGGNRGRGQAGGARKTSLETHLVLNNARNLPGKPVDYNNGLLSMNYGLLGGRVAGYFGLLGFPGNSLGAAVTPALQRSLG